MPGPGYLLAQSDARTMPLPDRSVHCVVTSPPYFGLRDYSTGRWEGGDDPACDHVPSREWIDHNFNANLTLAGSSKAQSAAAIGRRYKADGSCRKCGARRIDRQIGLEDSIEAYVDVMVRVFREVKRVLRDDGTLWVNMGDSYNSPNTHSGPADKVDWTVRLGQPAGTTKELKSKNLLGMPWRLAFALQTDGWVLRSDIIWAKANPMPESVTDRPTKSHEYLFLFAKSNVTQFWVHRSLPGTRTQPPPDYRWVHEDTGEEMATEPPGWREKGSPWDRENLWCGRDYYWDAESVREPMTNEARVRREAEKGMTKECTWKRYTSQGAMVNSQYGYRMHLIEAGGRNMRSVLTLPTESFPGAHFATFPRRLVEPCVKAGLSEQGCCPRCGAGWVRRVEKATLGIGYTDHEGDLTKGMSQYAPHSRKFNGEKLARFRAENPIKTTGWHPSCQCPPHAPVPCTILDPFVGLGTTLVVANALGRHAIGLDLSREYLVNQAQRRLERPHARPQRPARAEPAMPLFPSSHEGNDE